MKLVVGLGNPGKKYEGHRHNLGFMVVSRLASRHDIVLAKKKFNAIYSRSFISNRLVILALPLVFMNLIGGPVLRFAHFYKIAISDIIVIADDFNLDFGRIRIRKKGSDGGHNGIKSIIEHLGSKDFPRLRLGIGLPFNNCDISAYVLSSFNSKEKKCLDSFIDKSTDALESIIIGSIEKSMNEFNS